MYQSKDESCLSHTTQCLVFEPSESPQWKSEKIQLIIVALPHASQKSIFANTKN